MGDNIKKTFEDKSPLTQYFDLSIQIKKLEDNKAKLKEQCLDELKRLHNGKLQSDIGTLSITHTTKWTYSIFARERIQPLKEKQEKLEEEIKDIQKVDQNTGTADESSIEILRLQLKK